MGNLLGKSLRETITNVCREHLANGHLAMGQCLTAVGWVGGTLPELFEPDGMVELSMADVAGGGFAVGAALAGKRPFYIIRYQGFNWFNAAIPVNYAAKSKELWGRPSPMFIRSIAMEGAIGPVAGSTHASLYYRMPGITLVSPMTSNEYLKIYNDFMNNDSVYYVSEHRRAFPFVGELRDELYKSPDFTLVGISCTRFDIIKAAEILRGLGYSIGVVHIYEVKPLVISKEAVDMIANSSKGFMVLDDDYVDGIAKSISFNISSATGVHGKVLGLEERSAGFARHLDNLPPSPEKIVEMVKGFLRK